MLYKEQRTFWVILTVALMPGKESVGLLYLQSLENSRRADCLEGVMCTELGKIVLILRKPDSNTGEQTSVICSLQFLIGVVHF